MGCSFLFDQASLAYSQKNLPLTSLASPVSFARAMFVGESLPRPIHYVYHIHHLTSISTHNGSLAYSTYPAIIVEVESTNPLLSTLYCSVPSATLNPDWEMTA